MVYWFLFLHNPLVTRNLTSKIELSINKFTIFNFYIVETPGI